MRFSKAATKIDGESEAMARIRLIPPIAEHDDT